MSVKWNESDMYPASEFANHSVPLAVFPLAVLAVFDQLYLVVDLEVVAADHVGQFDAVSLVRDRLPRLLDYEQVRRWLRMHHPSCTSSLVTSRIRETDLDRARPGTAQERRKGPICFGMLSQFDASEFAFR